LHCTHESHMSGRQCTMCVSQRSQATTSTLWPATNVNRHSRRAPPTCTRPHSSAPGRSSSSWTA
jgi:hypothetical protein